MKKLLTMLLIAASCAMVFGQSGIPLGSNFNLNSGIPLDGRLVKDDIAARNAIPAVARYEGMEVFVESDGKYYQLIGGITNNDWRILDNSGVSSWPYNPVDTVQTVYIALDGDDETGDGSESSPYLTTQRAVQHVQGNMFTGGGLAAFVYGPGTWNADEIFPYIRDIDNEFSNLFGVRIMGTPTIGDTINITHPGTSVQSYFRFNTDSTIVGDNSNQFIGRLLHPIYGAIGYPIVEHTSDSLIFPGNNYAVGDNRFFFTLGTKFQVSDSTSMRMDKAYIINVEFIQTDSLDSFDFTNSNFLSFSNCKFYGEYGSYDLVQLEGVAQSLFYSCMFDWTASSYTGDIIEASFGGHSWANCHFYSPNVYEIDPKGGQGIELRPNFNHAEIDMCSFKGIAECIKHDGGGFISLGGLYADSAEIVIYSFDPRIKIWGESDNNVWADGYDSIICKDVDYLCDFRDVYDAGNFVFLPHLKAGGYDQFSVSGNFENDTWDMENLSFMSIGTDGIHQTIVDTVKAENYAKLYPEDPIDMSQYPVTDRLGATRWSPYYSSGKYEVQPGLGTQSFLNFVHDTIMVVDTTNRVFTIDQNTTILDTPDSVQLYSITRFDSDFRYVGNYVNPGRNISGEVNYFLIFPDAEDTVQTDFVNVRGDFFQIGNDGRVELDELTLHYFNSQVGAAASIDSFNVIKISSDDEGYDPDSLTKYFAIKHTWDDDFSQRVYGSDETYFLYSDYGDNYLNGDLDVHGRFMDYPYGTYNMADYPIGLIGATNMNAVNSRNGIITINPETGVNNAVYHYSDTIILNDIDRLFYKSSETTNISGTAVAVPAFVAPHTKNVYLNDFTSPGDVRPYNFNSLLYPDDGDTIDIRRLRGGYFQLQSYTPYANNRVVLDEALVVALYSAWDTEVSVDSVQGLQIWNRDVGIPQDSIDSYYGIYHKDAGSGLRGNDKTYFLYSEYGDNYLNGDLDVHGRFIEHQPASINMSNYRWDDGPPTYNIYKERSGNTDVALEDGAFNYLKLYRDTVTITAESDRLFGIDLHYTALNTEPGVTQDNGATSNWVRYLSHQNYINSVPTHRTAGYQFIHRLDPSADDTVKIADWSNVSIQSQSWSPSGPSRIDIGQETILTLFASYDDYMAVDSVLMLRLYNDDGGIDPDSIGKLYVIYNEDYDGLRGADETYFLYSEYGDNYLNGDLESTDLKEIYPATADLVDSEWSHPGQSSNSIFYQDGESDITLSTGFNMFDLRFDTVDVVATSGASFSHYYDYRTLNSEVDDTIPNFWPDVSSYNHHRGRFGALTESYMTHRLAPDDDDTIVVQKYNPNFRSFSVGNTASDAKVDVDELNHMYLWGSIADNAQIDSLMVIRMNIRDAGIPADSLSKYYGIYHEDDGLRGSDQTYFLYSEYGDNWLNGKLETSGNIRRVYSDIIDFNNLQNEGVLNYKYSDATMTPDNDVTNYFYRQEDTLVVSGLTKQLRYDWNQFHLKGEIERAVTAYQNALKVDSLKGTGALPFIVNDEAAVLFYPDDGDTIDVKNVKVRNSQFQSYTPYSNNRVSLDHVILNNIYSYFDEHTAVDSVFGIYIYNRMVDMPSDSISKYYGIYHEDEGDPLQGADETYFLYSEYGDNYLNGDLYTVGKHERNISRTIDAADYFKPALNNKGAYDYNFGTLDVTPETNRQFWVEYTSDTLNLSATSNRILGREYKQMVVDTDIPITSNYVEGHSDNLFLQNLDAANAWILGGRRAVGLWPEVDDTISVERVISQSVDIQTYTPSSTNRIDIGDAIGLYIYNTYDDYVQVDSIMGVFMELSNAGIPDDSIGSMYGIYNYDDGLRGSDQTYFAYSEYGDLFLGGGGELDQIGANITIGADIATPTGRTDATNKSGRIIAPHYTNAEEELAGLILTTTGTHNNVVIGGGNADYNAATRILLYAADNTTTTTGTQVGELTTSGLQLLNGAELDQYGFDLSLGSDHTTWTDKTDNTNKSGILSFPHYDIDEENSTGICYLNTDTDNVVWIGGGLSTHNAATYIRFNTASDYNTTSGTLTAQIDTSGLQLLNGAELDQYGHALQIGSDLLSEGDRTDATTKTGILVSPHYTNSEEPVEAVSMLSAAAENTLYLGGSNASYNGATRIRFLAADNTTDAAGNIVGGIDTDGFHIDTISELTTDEGISVMHDLTLRDGAELDQYGGYITLGGDDNDWTERTDNTNKSGSVVTPHYDTDEEDVFLIGSSNISPYNSITIGGGAGYNAATGIFLYAADNTTTLGGTWVGTVNTGGLDLLNAAELDQYGQNLKIGSDDPGYTSRTDNTLKVGSVILPHYDIDEEEITALGFSSNQFHNNVHIGGGVSGFNTATRIRLYSADNTTSTSATLVGSVEIDGFHIDTISELTTDNNVIVDDSLEVTGTITADQEITGQRIMKVMEAEILYSNTTQTTIVTLPADAVIWDIQVEVRTAFTGTGTDLLDIGTTGTANRYEDDLDLSSTGFKTMSLTNVPDRMTGSTDITFQYVDQNSDAGAGEAYVYVHYSLH